MAGISRPMRYRKFTPRLALWSVGLLMSAGGLAVPVAAQAAQGTFLGGGLGVGYGTMNVGDRSDSSGGLLLVGQVGRSEADYRTWFIDVGVHLFHVPSPVLDERYRAVTGLVRRSFGSEAFLAPGLGLEFRSWSGEERVESSDIGVVLGLAMGTSFRAGDALVLYPELAVGLSQIEFEGSVSGTMLSFRLVATRPWS